jgi:hypothetical protein
METHPSEKLLKELYTRFAHGDIEGVIAMCDESMVYKVPGSIPTSGAYSKHTFRSFIGHLWVRRVTSHNQIDRFIVICAAPGAKILTSIGTNYCLTRNSSYGTNYSIVMDWNSFDHGI